MLLKISEAFFIYSFKIFIPQHINIPPQKKHHLGTKATSIIPAPKPIHIKPKASLFIHFNIIHHHKNLLVYYIQIKNTELKYNSVFFKLISSFHNSQTTFFYFNKSFIIYNNISYSQRLSTLHSSVI